MLEFSNEGRELFARVVNGPMSPVNTSALRVMRGAPMLAAMRTAMEGAEAAGGQKAQKEQRQLTANSDDEM